MTTENDKKDRDWSTRAGTVKPGSLETFDKGKRALVVNAEGKESIVEAYGERNTAKLEEAATSGGSFVFRGPFYMKGGESHLMINFVKPQAEPKAEVAKPEMTEAEKAEVEKARAEAKQAREASRVLVEVGSVNPGDTVEKDGVSHEALFVGKSFEKDGAQVAYAYFGDVGAEMAARAAAEAEADAPEKDDSLSP